MITVNMFKAKFGDAFLLSFGEDYDINIMIDMGFDDTYEDYIKPKLLELSKLGKKLDLLVITHIDRDHIGGALSFIEDNGTEQKIIKVGEVWHNTYRHLQFNKMKVERVSSEERVALKEIINRNTLQSVDDGLSDITVEDGVLLGRLLLKYGYNWNSKFNNKAVSSYNSKTIKIANNLNILMLSPNKVKLDKLATLWSNKLDDIFYDFEMSDEQIFDDAFECFMQTEQETEISVSNISSKAMDFDIEKLAEVKEKDRSFTNGASIAFIIEYNDKKMLFLGDAHEDIVYEELLSLKENYYDLSFELVKISHHGSNKNISKRILELINCKRYLISTNGAKHEHPDIEALAKIITDINNSPKEIVFNYDLEKIRPLCDNVLKEKYKYEIQYKNEIVLKAD